MFFPFYAQIPVCHVEAGLRTHNIYSPWPEEINRQITGRIASFHLAPTELSRKNLLKENIDPTKIEVVGNTVIDAFHMALSLLISNKIAPLMKQKANTPMDYKRTNSCISLKSILSLQKQTPQLP